MSSKLGLIISLAFFSIFFVLCIDVMCIQYYYADLDSKSVIIGYELSRLDNYSSENITSIEERYNVSIMDISNTNPEFGDSISYTILKEYKPIIVSNDVMEIKISRSTVRGYY